MFKHSQGIPTSWKKVTADSKDPLFMLLNRRELLKRRMKVQNGLGNFPYEAVKRRNKVNFLSEITKAFIEPCIEEVMEWRKYESFQLSRPILLQDIEHTPEDRKAIVAWELQIVYTKRLGHQVMFLGRGSWMITVPNQYAQALQVVIHQNRVYRNMMVQCDEQVNKDLIDPVDVNLYANVAAYLRDVLHGFEEECDKYMGSADQFRSAHLNFHFALVIAGRSSFTPGSTWKLEKKLGATWESILRGEEVPEIEKWQGEAAYHALMCITGLSGERVDEFKSKAVMALEKGTGEKGNPKEVVPAEKGKGKEVVPVEKGKGKEVVPVEKGKGKDVVPVNKGKGKEVIPANKGKGKEVVPADKGKRKAISWTMPVEGRSQMLTIKLLGSGPQGVQKQGTTNQKDSTKKQAKSGGNHSDDQTASVMCSTQIAAQEALDQFSVMDISLEKDTRGKDKSLSSNPGKDRQGKGVANHLSKAPTVDAQSKGKGNNPLKDTGTSGQGGLVGSIDLIPQSPDAYPFPHYDDYLEALGLERLYAALGSAEESPGHLVYLFHALGRAALNTNQLSHSNPRFEPLEPLPPTMLGGPRQPPDKNVVADAEDPIEDEVEVSEMVDTGADGDVDSISDKDTDQQEGGEDVEEDGSEACAGTMVVDRDLNCGGISEGGESREGTDGESKRKRADSLAFSPPKVRGRWLPYGT
ncbi:hypothetical protein DFH29DRAFT_882808 [Suillus ampliporus]|nr:hypothetical protein DFH29DRAFT_882808 [Suillus ampliporus]